VEVIYGALWVHDAAGTVYDSHVTAAELTVSTRRDGVDAVLAVAGEIDLSTAPQLRAAVEAALADRPDRVILDFGGVTFCDSQGLSTLILLSRTSHATGSRLVLVHLGEFLVRLLDITGLKEALLDPEATP
jgi:anti-anti-sigma factor